MNNLLFFFTKKKISNLQDIVPVLEYVLQAGRSLIIVAEDVDGEALAALVINRLRAGIKVCAVKAPGFGDMRKNNLKDIAIVTGGQVISEDAGMSLKDAVNPGVMGVVGKCVITKTDSLFLEGAGNADDVGDRCEQIREAIELSTSTYEQDKLKERLAKLSSGVAVIKVGGGSEVAMNEKKDRITDSLNATRAAVEEGVVTGGGCALMYASKCLVGFVGKNDDQTVGIDIVRRAIQVPAKTIVRNAGEEGSVVVGKLMEQDDICWGYDSYHGEYKDMIAAGIIDPVKVVRTALADAASVAGLLTTTEAVIVDEPQEAARGHVGAELN